MTEDDTPKLTTDRVTEIGRQHGLSLTDCLALKQLATSEEEAEKLAARFADDDEDPKAVADRIISRKGGV